MEGYQECLLAQSVAQKTPQASLDLRVPTPSTFNFDGGILAIHVGNPTSPTVFNVDGKMVCSNSKFFKAVITHDFEERKSRIIALPNHLPDTFRVWLNWIMHHTILSSITTATGLDCTKEFTHLVDAYILGQKLVDVAFQDAIMDAIVAIPWTKGSKQGTLHCFQISTIYRKTLPDSVLRQFVIDQYAECGNASRFFPPCVHDYDDEFMIDLAVEFMDRRDGETWTVPTACRYHAHETLLGMSFCPRTTLKK